MTVAEEVKSHRGICPFRKNPLVGRWLRVKSLRISPEGELNTNSSSKGVLK
jgi:hypothetical protein